MSNTAVGGIYKKVIDAVIEASRNDFEENGVNVSVLEAMKEKWQHRLTASARAQFPWDPQSEPPQQLKERAQLYGNGPPVHEQMPVKQEGYDTGFLNLPPRAPGNALGNPYAPQRAIMLMQQQYGSQANNSINALQAAQMQQRQQASRPPQPTQSQYAAGNAGQQSSPVKQESQVKQEADEQNGLGTSQLDGASDTTEWDAVIARRNAHGDHEPMGRIAIDRRIRDMIERNAERLEGGGLMVPLEERLPAQRRRFRQQEKRRLALAASSESPQASSQHSAQSSSAPQFGGDMADDDDDEDDLDEDAINSDLDDPDETADTTQEGVYDGDVILCLYDKVQRVKNRWKCALREGILTIDGKDYIFHKATGEFDW